MRCILAVLVVLLVGGCASTKSEQTYAEQIAQIPTPNGEDDKQKKCAYLRSEIARQQNIATYASQMQGIYATAGVMGARNNIATLESRASDFNCNAAFGASRPPESSISVCIEACKANTERSSEQCFDSCNH